MFGKILVANRGEIALRVIRTCRVLGIPTVAVYSTADRASLHVRHADEAYLLGPAAATESYLRIDRLIDVARRSGADAVHPGYGFLAESEAFAEACAAAGLVFLGPRAETMRRMGDKVAARQLASAAGVPVVPGTEEPVATFEEARHAADRIGFPLLLKAAAGGGGKGMRRVDRPEDLASAFRAAVSEASASFGRGDVYLERYIGRARHVEVQILGDGRGGVVHFGDRGCSVQRRHQKLIEEAPAPALSVALRRRLHEAAVRLAAMVEYAGAGTVEFIVEGDEDFFFLEMNTRLQVEHPVTEMITGRDLVADQIHVAAAGALPCAQDEVAFRGHALECRIMAEDPHQNFMPAPGHIHHLREPGGPGVRWDGGVASGSDIPMAYDPLIGKLIAWADDRPRALRRMAAALDELVLCGPPTTIPFHQLVLRNDVFLRGDYDTTFIDQQFLPAIEARGDHPELRLVARLAALLNHAAAPPRAAEPPAVTGRRTWALAARLMSLRGGAL